MLSTPGHTSSILDGITPQVGDPDRRATSATRSIERDVARSELYLADEVFLIGTAAELVPVREIDDHDLGEPGEITRCIQAQVRGRAARARPRVPRMAGHRRATE